MRVDNFLYLLQVSRTGKLRDAATNLNVDETTVSRGIGRLEKDLSTRLFDRGPHGWCLTEQGERLLPYAESIEFSVAGALETAGSSAGELTGTARILSPDGFGAYVLIPGLRPLFDERPQLNCEILTATKHDLLTARDFDVAVTLERPSTRGSRVAHLADYELRFYASQEYLSARPAPLTVEDLRKDHHLVWYVDALLDVKPLRFLADLIPQAHARIQTTSIAGHHAAARAGLGIVPLPTYIGAEDESLVEVLPEVLRARRSYWLVVPSELASLVRVQEVAQAIHDLVDANPHLYPTP